MIRVLAFLVLLFISWFSSNGQEMLLQTGHFYKIHLADVTKDGSTLLSAAEDGRVLFWDIKSRIQTKSLSVFNDPISTFSYNKNHELLAVGSFAGYFKLFNLKESDSIPIIYKKGTYEVTTTAISPNGKIVATGNADFLLHVFVDGKEKVLKMTEEFTGLAFSPDSKKLYISCNAGNIYVWDTKTPFSRSNLSILYQADGFIGDLAISEDGSLLIYGCISPGENKAEGEIGVVQIKKKKNIFKLFTPYSNLGFKSNSFAFVDNEKFLYRDSLGQISMANIQTKESYKYIEEFVYSVSYSNFLKSAIYPVDREIRIHPIKENSQEIVYKGYINKPRKLLAAKGDTLFVEYDNGIIQWDLRKLSYELYKEKFYQNKWDYQFISSDLKYECIIERDLKNRYKRFRSLYLPYDGLRLLAFSDQGDKVAMLSYDGHFQVCEILKSEKSNYKKLKNIFYNKFSMKERVNINLIKFNPKGNKIVVASNEYNYIMELDSMRKKTVAYYYRQSDFKLPVFFHPYKNEVWMGSTITRSDSFSLAATDPGTGWESIERTHNITEEIYYDNRLSGIATIWGLDSQDYQGYIYNDVPNKYKINELAEIIYQPINDKIYFFYTDNSVGIAKANENEVDEWKLIKLPCYGVESVLFSYDKNFIYVNTTEGSILVLDPLSLKVICSLYSLTNGEYFIMTQDYYFKRSKNITNAVAFRNGNSLARINTYDVVFNRPYRVMEELGLESKDKIALVKKLASKNNSKIASNDAPILKITNSTEIGIVTDKSSLTFNYEVTSKAAVSHLSVKVNGVPIGNLNKVKRNVGNIKSMNGSFKVPLARGKNNIAISAYNVHKQESEIRMYSITCNKPFKKPNLHLIVIYVSEYKDSRFNLTYAVKDGRDLVNTYADKDGKRILGFPNRYDQIIIDTLFNEDATRENYLALQNKLMNGNPEDHVYVYVSGHGLLDSAYNFWFGTHDVDFDDPSKKGLYFESIEGLLVNAAARQRLILMDACHSGEVLKDEITSIDTVQLPYGAKGKILGFGYKGTVVVNAEEDKVDLSELKQNLFSNYNSKSGATVISAAAGNSYALESDEWNNGIFTYSILAGLTERLADLNNDGEVTLVELSKFVNKEVKNRTFGRQIPNDRQENSENNFRLW